MKNYLQNRKQDEQRKLCRIRERKHKQKQIQDLEGGNKSRIFTTMWKGYYTDKEESRIQHFKEEVDGSQLEGNRERYEMNVEEPKMEEI